MRRIIVIIATLTIPALVPTAPNPVSAHSALLPAHSLVADLDFISPRTGWVIVYSPRIAHVGNACDYDLSRTPVTVLKTVDSGAHWSTQFHFVGAARIAGNQRLPGAWIRFTNGRDGFVAGPSGQKSSWLYRTRDGGRTWRRLRLPGMPGGCVGDPLSFPSARNGWLLADVMAAMGQSEANIFHTTDGGTHWVRVAYARLVGPPGNLGAGGDKSSIVFCDGAVGWVTAPSPAGPGFAYSTGDGGRHWALQILPLPGGSRPRDALAGQGFPSPPVVFGPTAGFLAADIVIIR